MTPTSNTPTRNKNLTEKDVRTIVMAICPEIEIKYIQIFDRNEWDEEKQEWVSTDESVHLKVTKPDIGIAELEKFLDDHTGIGWMVDIG